MERLKNIKCNCGCGLVLDFTKPEGAIVPKNHYLDHLTLTIKPVDKTKIQFIPMKLSKHSQKYLDLVNSIDYSHFSVN